MSERSSSAGSYRRGTGDLPPSPLRRRRRRREGFIVSLIAILLCILALLFFLPRPGAIVTLKPIIKAQSGTVSASYTPRDLSSSQQGTQTGKIAGGSQACGMLTFKNYTSSWVTIPMGTIVSGDTGQQIMTEQTIRVPPDPIVPGVASVSAKALKAGKEGNIPAMSINRLYIAGIYVFNGTAFSGGTDGQIVQQSDIDRVARPLTNLFQRTALKDLQAQLKPGEFFTQPNPVCSTPIITSNPGAGARASVFTVSVSLKCTDAAYNPQTVPFQTEELLKQQAVRLLTPGPDFSLIGDLTIRIDRETPVIDGQVEVQGIASGKWAYQFTATAKQNMAKHIARAAVSAAKAWLLQQTGVADVSISVSGPLIDLSGARVLPDDLRAITVRE